MFKHIKNEKGEALLIFLFGLMFTMVVAAKETNNLETKLKECQTPQTASIMLSK